MLQNVSLAMAESILSGIIAWVAHSICDAVVEKAFTLAWRTQKICDAYYVCMTFWRLSQPHKIVGMIPTLGQPNTGQGANWTITATLHSLQISTTETQLDKTVV